MRLILIVKYPYSLAKKPLWNTKKSDKGNECPALDAVLLPGEQINILDLEARPILPVDYLLGKRVLKGYIH